MLLSPFLHSLLDSSAGIPSARHGDNIGDDFEVLVFSYSLYSASFGDLAFQDFIWIAGSASFVLVYMCIHTGSIYLGLFGIIQILLAYPFTYFFYR